MRVGRLLRSAATVGASSRYGRNVAAATPWRHEPMTLAISRRAQSAWYLVGMSQWLRPATRDDLAAVQEIVRTAYAPYIARIGREPGPMLDDYAAMIGASQVHVGIRDGAVQGILVLIPQDGTMLLDNVAVAPEARGTGLGRLLIEFAERTAIEAGHSAIKLYTNEAMTENIALYARLGYAETHRVEEQGLRRVYMRKPLASA